MLSTQSIGDLTMARMREEIVVVRDTISYLANVLGQGRVQRIELGNADVAMYQKNFEKFRLYMEENTTDALVARYMEGMSARHISRMEQLEREERQETSNIESLILKNSNIVNKLELSLKHHVDWHGYYMQDHRNF